MYKSNHSIKMPDGHALDGWKFTCTLIEGPAAACTTRLAGYEGANMIRPIQFARCRHLYLNVKPTCAPYMHCRGDDSFKNDYINRGIVVLFLSFPRTRSLHKSLTTGCHVVFNICRSVHESGAVLM
jgi:hypothetical protein